MVTLVTQNPSGWQAAAASPSVPDPLPMRAPGTPTRGRRSPKLVVIGTLCTLLGALGVTTAFTQLNDTTTVVAMARTVHRGQKVTQADLTTITISAAPGLKTLPAEQLQGLVGKTALVDLPAQALVGTGMVGEAPLPEGSAQLGLKLESGRLPASPMPPGTRIKLVEVHSTKAAPDEGGVQPKAPRSFPATVMTTPLELPDGASWVVDVSLADSEAETVAGLAAAGKLVVVRTAG